MLKPLPVKMAPFLIIPFLLVLSCSRKADVEMIRQLVERGATLAENHETDGLMKLVSDDFLAMPGQHDRVSVVQILWVAFKYYGQFEVLYPEPSIDFKEGANVAFASIHFLIVKKDRSYPNLKGLYKDPQAWLEAVGENADLYRLKLELLKGSDHWVVRRAYLEGFRGFGFSEEF
jgi:hypothetical protein